LSAQPGILFNIFQDTIPYPSEYGINSPSGMQTVLALNQVQTSLANTPTKRCEPRDKFNAFDHVLNKTQAYENQLADCTTFEHMSGVRTDCHCTIEGVLKVKLGDKPERNYCNDILGAQEPKKMLKLLDEVMQFLEKDQQEHNYAM
uniref:Interleukin n=1 Tax=Macrostomum lignano TaxID=282301 RepID=A0A1I8HCT0_9PLAT